MNLLVLDRNWNLKTFNGQQFFLDLIGILETVQPFANYFYLIEICEPYNWAQIMCII